MESPSSAVQVQMFACPIRRGLGVCHVLLLGVVKRPDFIALHPRVLHAADLCVMEGRARLAGIRQQLATVLIDTSTTREIDRMEEPSHSMERIWTRLAQGQLVHAPYI